MSNLLVTTINSANGTTDMTVATGNTSAPKIILYSNGAGSYTDGLIKSNGYINGSQSTLTTTTTLTLSCFGTLVQAVNGPYTVTLPSPVNGACFQFWPNTSSTITLSTPTGAFYGPNGSGSSTIALNGTQLYLLSSDGSNWIITNVSTLAPNIAYTRYDTITEVAIPSAGNGSAFIPGLSTLITPRKSNSKILIQISLYYETGENCNFMLYRSIGGVDTLINRNVNDSGYWAGGWTAAYDNNTSTTPTVGTFIFLDTPNTTSAITYKLGVQSSYSSSPYLAINRSYALGVGASFGQANYEVGISQMFLQEIGV